MGIPTALPAGLPFRSLTEAATRLRSRDISSTELTNLLLDRIDAFDSTLNSFTTVTRELALQQARHADERLQQGHYLGPLHGIPVAVKDLFFTKGIVTTAGMVLHREFRPTYDATVVRRLAEAGAVLLGKLHLTEGACIEHHPDMPRPLNPWRSDIWAGASSSGCGVATAAGLCFGSIGSDTGGSIRFPSACNGLTGLKPTWGRVSRYGIFDLAPSYDTIGPVTRSAEDAAAMLSVIAGHDLLDPTSLASPVPDYLGGLDGIRGARGVRIGLDYSYNNDGAEAATIAMVEGAARDLEGIGAEIRPVTFPDPSAMSRHMMEVHMAELAVSHEATYPAQADRYGRWISRGLKAGLEAQAVDIARTHIERDRFKGRLERVFDDVDLVLMPVFQMGTPTWDEVEDLVENNPDPLFRFTMPMNASGSPTLTLPGGFTADGRPLGFQLVGRHGAEAELLRVGHAYQMATDWHRREPAIF